MQGLRICKGQSDSILLSCMHDVYVVYYTSSRDASDLDAYTFPLFPQFQQRTNHLRSRGPPLRTSQRKRASS